MPRSNYIYMVAFYTTRDSAMSTTRADAPGGPAATHAECVLCAYHGNLAVVNRQILNYIEDAISHVGKAEICCQVVCELEQNGMHMTESDVLIHIDKHMINKHVIMSNIVHDLIDIARASKQSCLLTSEETGQPAVDPKYASIYFKAVDQLGAIMRSEAYKPNKHTG